MRSFAPQSAAGQAPASVFAASIALAGGVPTALAQFEPLWLFRTRGARLLPSSVYPREASRDRCKLMLALARRIFRHFLLTGASTFEAREHTAVLTASHAALPDDHGLIIIRVADTAHEDELARLRTDNRELEAILASSHDGIVVADGKGILLRISDSYPRITGVPREEIVGMHIDKMVASGIASPSGTSLVLNRKRTVTFTQTFRGGKESIVTSTPVFDDAGTIIRVVTNVRDMTEIQSLRSMLAESQKKIDQYSQMVESLTREAPGDAGSVLRSASMESLRERALKYAPVDAPLLITGESGVGKEVIANVVHRHSLRGKAPFLKINCGAIPEQLLESELFGYEGGAFTGARREGHAGLIEMAKNGTLLLDEIGELPLSLQVKLLRLVQNKEFFRVGGNRPLSTDVRIIASTNQNIEMLVEERRFRADLFYRLNVLRLHIPSLAERPEDIVPLTHYFLNKFNEKHKTDKKFSPAVYRAFEHHAWRGNVRELENIVERLVIVCSGSLVDLCHLPDEMRNTLPVSMEKSYKEALEDFEKEYWKRALIHYKSYRLAARHLGVDHSTIIKKSARLGIPPLKELCPD